MIKKSIDFSREIDILQKLGFKEVKESWPKIPCWRFVKGYFTVSLWFSGEITSWKYVE